MLRKRLKILGGVFDSDKKQKEIKLIEQEIQSPDFWNNQEKAEKKIQRMNYLREILDPWSALKSEADETIEYIKLLEEEGEEDAYLDEIEKKVSSIKKQFDTLIVQSLLNGKYDNKNAFFTIHSGAGGTEACDWVNMLLRMYMRWTERKNYPTEILDMQEAEGGIKSVTIQINGKNVYGYLKGEAGIHRLVRISPFDSNKRRHTSFASVYVSPVIDDEIEIDIKPEDIRVDTYRASGAGGQHVNKTDSAVRITHFETGIVVQCQNERSQHKNRATALRVLKSRLLEYFEEKQEKEQAEHAIEKKDISWGNQIRSYVFHPYTMVKDHRTNEQVGNIQAVMDGDLDRFIEAFLKQNWN
ncbi:MAG: peptide chain release factor 2 [Spirochaetia bacterium]|nr:peptide chain release factor 2 [Spirochaetia bacterium]